MSNHDDALVVDVIHALLEHDDYYDMATAAIVAVRAHDAVMPCGHCDPPGLDSIRCACKIGDDDE